MFPPRISINKGTVIPPSKDKIETKNSGINEFNPIIPTTSAMIVAINAGWKIFDSWIEAFFSDLDVKNNEYVLKKKAG